MTYSQRQTKQRKAMRDCRNVKCEQNTSVSWMQIREKIVSKERIMNEGLKNHAHKTTTQQACIEKHLKVQALEKMSK